MSFSSEAFTQILLIFFLLPCSICQPLLDALTPNQPIRDSDVLISGRKVFALGFFSPGNSRYHYVGVWFNNIPNQTIVWVANRDNPVNDTSGVLSINGDEGLVIHGNEPSTPIWSANITLSSPQSFTAKLLDTGNLVLLENSQNSQKVVWEGFYYPSDTRLSFMKVALNRRFGLEWRLTSWKSKDDPGIGSCTCGIDPRRFPQLFVHKGGVPIWRVGPWIGDRWSGVPRRINAVGVYNEIFVNNEDEISYMAYMISELITRGVLDESGTFSRNMWNDQKKQWVRLISGPNEWCDNYGQCGPNSKCDPYKVDDTFACTCLPGFEPKSPSDWYMRVGVAGCIRKEGACRMGEGFVKVVRVKLPDSSTAHVNMSLSLKDCELECLMNCSCTAYTSADVQEGGIGCVTWHGDLMDTRTYSNVG